MAILAGKIKKHRNIALAFLGSVVLHAFALAVAQLWGLFGEPKSVEASLRHLEGPTPRLNVELIQMRKPLLPQPYQQARLSQPPNIIAPVRSGKSLASPKRGRIVLPDEALRNHPKPRKGEITAQMASIPAKCVAPQSQAGTPVIATPEVFTRTDSLAPSTPGEYGLGGTGNAVGAGPFGDNPDGSGTMQQGGEPMVPPNPKKVSEAEPPPVSSPPSKVVTLEKPTPPKGPTCGPKLLEWKDPPYPELARQEGRQGTVVLRTKIDIDGKPKQVEVAVSSGSEILDRAALEYMKLAKFSPALKEGSPIPAVITFRVRFKLNPNAH